MSFWERLRVVSDASRRRIKTVARDALEGVDGIEVRALEKSPTAQARSMVRGGDPGVATFEMSSPRMELPPSPSQTSPETSRPSQWSGPPAPDFPSDPEFMDESVPSRSFPNSMGFSDDEIETLLRVEHYPHLEGFDVDVLYTLARMEGRLLRDSGIVGKAWVDLLGNLVDEDEIWEAALYFTGAHHEPALLESMHALGNNPLAEDYCALGYALLPFGVELLGASAGASDPHGLREALAELMATMQEREAFGAVKGHEGLAAELSGLPMKPRGVFAFRGFDWIAP